MIYAFDPGLCTGFAAVGPDDIVCDILTPANDSYIFKHLMGSGVCYIERPMWRSGGSERNPQDLLTLSCRAGELFGRVKHEGRCSPSYLFPHDWKRGLNKEMTEVRIKKMLTPSELKKIEKVFAMPDTRRHNALDALGIALFGAGRRLF